MRAALKIVFPYPGFPLINRKFRSVEVPSDHALSNLESQDFTERFWEIQSPVPESRRAEANSYMSCHSGGLIQAFTVLIVCCIFSAFSSSERFPPWQIASSFVAC